MYDLILDSSNSELLIAVAKDNNIIDRIEYEAWQRQSELMTFELDKLLKRNNIDKKDIDSILLPIGPGSYTGIRISLTIGKIFAYALNIKIYPFSSLQILKTIKKPSICLINARSGRSYIGVYDDENIILKDTILKNEEVIEYINNHPNYDVCGDVKYLNLNGKTNDKVLNMLTLKQYIKPLDSFHIKPVYLKD